MTRAEQLAGPCFSHGSDSGSSALLPARRSSAHIQAKPHEHSLRSLTEHWRRQRLALRRHLLQLLSCDLNCDPLPASADHCRTLQVLCADLLDYLSIGHFRIYGRILRNQRDHDDELQVLLRHLLHHIGYTTDAVLAFNDRFGHHTCITPQLVEELARLSRCLLLRFALEEQLLDLTAEAAAQIHS